MKNYAAIIFVDQALTKDTYKNFKYCELNADQTHVRFTETTRPNYLTDVFITVAVRFLAAHNRIDAAGFWLIESQAGKKFTYHATQLFTEA